MDWIEKKEEAQSKLTRDVREAEGEHRFAEAVLHLPVQGADAARLHLHQHLVPPRPRNWHFHRLHLPVTTTTTYILSRTLLSSVIRFSHTAYLNSDLILHTNLKAMREEKKLKNSHLESFRPATIRGVAHRFHRLGSIRRRH
jgi:hypothetical protein